MATRQLSLLNLLLIVTTVAALCGLWALSRRNAVLVARHHVMEQQVAVVRDENKALREQFGYLNIDDKAKIHAIRVADSRPLTWVYRVFLPANGRYFAACRINGLPASGQAPQFVEPPPDERTVKSGRGNEVAIGLSSGEYLITVSIQADEQEARYVLNCRSTSRGGRSAGGGSEIVGDADAWPRKRGSFCQLGVVYETSMTPLDETLVLLERRAIERVGNSQESDQGVVCWIESY